MLYVGCTILGTSLCRGRALLPPKDACLNTHSAQVCIFNLPWQRKPTHTSPCQGIPVCQNTVSVALQSYSKGHLLHSPIFPSVSSLTIFKVNQLQRQGCAKLFHRQTLLCFIPGALHTPNTTFLCTFTAITGFQSESSSNSTSHRSSFPHYTSVVPIRVCWREMYECCTSAQ